MTHLIRTDVTRLVQNLIGRKYLAEDTVFSRNNIYAASTYVRLGERASDIILRGEVFKFSITKKSKKASAAVAKKKPTRTFGSVLDDDFDVNPESEPVDGFIEDYPEEDEENSANPGPSKGRTIRTYKKKAPGSASKKKRTYTAGTNRRVSTYFKKTSAKPCRKPKTIPVNQFMDDDGYINVPD